MPLVVSTTLAPAAKILRIRSRVISASLHNKMYKFVPARSEEQGLPLANVLQLLRIVNKNLDTELHARLLKIDVETSDLSISDAFLHG